jgi:hypothetical protein
LRVFPNGRTAYIPSDGRPLPGYEVALADIKRRGKDLPAAIEMAHDEHQGVKVLSELFAKTDQTEEEDPDEAADTIAATAPGVSPTTDALAAALERLAARKREAAAQVANAADRPALYHTASLEETPAGRAPQRVAGLTPNQVIVARGYWQGLPDGQVAAQPASAPSASAPSRKTAASAVPDITSAFKAFAGAPRDRVPTDLALAYAAQPEPNASVLPSSAPTTGGPTSQPPKATQPREIQARLPVPAPPVGTTIAMKRDADQATSTIVAPPLPSSASPAPNTEPDNPWLRALLLSPNLGSYLTTLMLGAEDFRALAALVEQPKSSVMMTFTSEPNLTADRFSGSAIVFVPTITYQARTSALR